MAATAAAAAPRPLLEDVVKATNFTRQEAELLNQYFGNLALPSNDKIDRATFRDLLADNFGIDDSLIMDRVFRCFDNDADNYISYDEFMRGMSVFLKGKPDERMRFCFRVYDLNGDHYIVKEEMFQMLKNCLVKGSEEDEDGVKDLVDMVLKKLDEDRDGRVSEGDWGSAIQKESLLMEAFGQCLPFTKDIIKYLDVTRLGSRGKQKSYMLGSFSGARAAGSGAVPRSAAGASVDAPAASSSGPKAGATARV